MTRILVSLTVAGLLAAADNPELKEIYSVDQSDRMAKVIDWPKILPRDKARRDRVRQMLDQGLVGSGKDFERAAMVFQHGDGSDDILMAHVLAVTAIGKGNLDARWLAAAALDRFLHRVGQPQVFGTQYTKNAGQPWSMEPYNRSLIGAAVRDANCVPHQDDQLARLNSLIKDEEPRPPARQPCADSRLGTPAPSAK